MIKTHIKSWFEIWCDDYINKNVTREDKDNDLVILQIEQGFDNNYIVELIKPDDYKQPLFSMKG